MPPPAGGDGAVCSFVLFKSHMRSARRARSAELNIDSDLFLFFFCCFLPHSLISETTQCLIVEEFSVKRISGGISLACCVAYL